MAAPVPLAILTVDQIVLDILPAAEGLLECSLIVEVLIDIVEAYDTFSLYPMEPSALRPFSDAFATICTMGSTLFNI